MNGGLNEGFEVPHVVGLFETVARQVEDRVALVCLIQDHHVSEGHFPRIPNALITGVLEYRQVTQVAHLLLPGFIAYLIDGQELDSRGVCRL